MSLATASMTNLKRSLDKYCEGTLYGIENYNVERKNDTSMEIVKAGNKYAMQVKKKYIDQSQENVQ